MTNAEDPILVRRALQADPESFGQLCRRYYPSLVAVADSILLDHHLAEDAAQEALADACRQLPAAQGARAFRALGGGDLPKRGERYAPGPAEAASRPSPTANRRRQTAGRMGKMKLWPKRCAHLPQPLREVVYLRFYNGLSYQQIAGVLGASQESIDGRLRRAKKKIAAFMKAKGFEP